MHTPWWPALRHSVIAPALALGAAVAYGVVEFVALQRVRRRRSPARLLTHT